MLKRLKPDADFKETTLKIGNTHLKNKGIWK